MNVDWAREKVNMGWAREKVNMDWPRRSVKFLLVEKLKYD